MGFLFNTPGQAAPCFKTLTCFLSLLTKTCLACVSLTQLHDQEPFQLVPSTAANQALKHTGSPCIPPDPSARLAQAAWNSSTESHSRGQNTGAWLWNSRIGQKPPWKYTLFEVSEGPPTVCRLLALQSHKYIEIVYGLVASCFWQHDGKSS